MEEIYNKVLNKQQLSTNELKTLVHEGDIINIQYGNNRRWLRNVVTIVSIEDKLFAISWEEGLTENQEDEFYVQPYEVEMVEEVKTITLRSYKRKL